MYEILYDITSDYAMLGLTLIVLFFMAYTKPRRTPLYFVNVWGLCFSGFAIAAELHLVNLATDRYDVSQNFFVYVNVTIALFLFCYLGVILFLYNYVALFALKKRQNLKRQNMINLLIIVIYVASAVGFLLSGKQFVDLGDGLDIAPTIRFYTLFGIATTLLVYVTSLLNRKDVARIVWIDILVFDPFAALVLLLQMFRPYNLIGCYSYVISFTALYFLFHSNPFDELSGVQNHYSLDSVLKPVTKRQAPFAMACFDFPQLEMGQSDQTRAEIERGVARLCRFVEARDKRYRIYRVNDSEFAVMRTLRRKEVGLLSEFERDMKATMKKAVHTGNDITYGYLLIFRDHPVLSNPNRLRGFAKYMLSRAGKRRETIVMTAKDADYDDFCEIQDVAEALEDIRQKEDLNDPRVLCYAQPIYDVGQGSFRTAEALMRLQIGGRTISPAVFIPLAEKENSIHSLTKIILNKVCTQIAEMNPLYDFDAITINVSAVELSDEQTHHNLLEIIGQHNVPHDKLRLELTESAMSENYETVHRNMEELRKAGIKFYLDDFGTGYSNLERLSSMDFSTIKFDKSILYKAMENRNTEEMISAMIDLFKKKGVIPLVEGVESEEQSQYSIERGFEYIQGFRYAKPIPIDRLTEYFGRKEKT